MRPEPTTLQPPPGTRRRRAPGALALALLLAGCGAAADAPPRPRNLLFLCVDTLRADHLEPWGARKGASPRIDALAARGVVFERAVSHASWTLPSFAAILTSTYASTNGCRNLETRLPAGFTTLPELFRDAGFDTFGVASHIFFREEYGLQQGFESFDASIAYKREEEGWRPLSSPYVSEQARAFLEERRRAGDPDPFLLWLHYFDPHLPYVDHTGVGNGREQEHARYRAEIAYTDRFLGDVLDALEETGQADETVVVLLSDHGEAWEEHPGVRRHSRSLFREELDVPLVLVVPGVAPRRVADPVRTVDLMPTLLELFGLEVPPGIEGRSFLGTLNGGAFEAPPLLAEIELHDDQHHRRALVESDWKLIETADGRHLLFDRTTDPEERVDRAAAEPERLRAMVEELEAQTERARALGRELGEDGSFRPSAETLDRLDELGYGGDSD